MENAAAADDDAPGVFRLSLSKPPLPKIFAVCRSKWRRDFHRPGAALSRVHRDKQLVKMRPAVRVAAGRSVRFAVVAFRPSSLPG